MKEIVFSILAVAALANFLSGAGFMTCLAAVAIVGGVVALVLMLIDIIERIG